MPNIRYAGNAIPDVSATKIILVPEGIVYDTAVPSSSQAEVIHPSAFGTAR